jgi:peptidoglycan/LPS O-acetylase OafA/YrhL
VTGALQRQIPALDGIRGVAIVWVLFHNTTAMPLAPFSRALHLLPMLANLGWVGVQLFFALSGFLITGGLLDTRGSPHYFRNFYAKRALRILPLYYAVLLLLLVVLPRLITPPVPFGSAHQAPLWLFMANWDTHALPYGFAHFWSLAIEEQFYLLWPLVVWALPTRRLLQACLWVALGALLLRCALAAYGASGWTLYTNTACRMDALSLGGAGACLLRMPAAREQIRARLALLGGAAVAVFLAGIPLTRIYYRDGISGETFGYTLLAFSSAAFVTRVAAQPDRSATLVVRLLEWGPLRSCGKYSYAMYVLHNLLHKLLGEPWLLGRFGSQPPLPVVFAYALVVLLATYALSFVSYHAFETHFLRLKRLFEPRAAHSGARL